MPLNPDNQTANTGSKPTRTSLLWTILALAFIGFIYFSIPCYRFFSDGIQFAIEIRYSPDWILHPHHILYPLLPQIFAKVFGPGSGELDFLVTWSQIAGILSCIGMVLLLRAGSIKTPATIVGLAIFAFSNGIWYFSVTPNQNSQALVLHVFTLLAILKAGRKYPDSPSGSDILLITFLTVFSILANQVNAVLILPTIWILLRSRSPSQNKALNLFIFIVITFLSLILLIGIAGIFLGGFSTISDFTNWQSSYAYQHRWWVSGLLDAWGRNLVGIFSTHFAEPVSPGPAFGSPSQAFGSLSQSAILTLRIGQYSVVMFFMFEFVRACFSKLDKIQSYTQTLGLLTALPIFIFSIFYIPENLNLRILYIPGFLLFLLPSIENFYFQDNFKLKKAFPVLLTIIILLVVNLGAKYIPASRPTSNPFLVETGQLLESVDPDDMIIYPWTDKGHTLSLYAQYFIGCDALTINKLRDIGKALPENEFTQFLAGPDPERKIWINEQVFTAAYSSDSLSGLYDETMDSTTIDAFIEKWFVPTTDRITAGDTEYTCYLPIDHPE